jgi:hypothetical protein
MAALLFFVVGLVFGLFLAVPLAVWLLNSKSEVTLIMAFDIQADDKQPFSIVGGVDDKGNEVTLPADLVYAWRVDAITGDPGTVVADDTGLNAVVVPGEVGAQGQVIVTATDAFGKSYTARSEVYTVVPGELAGLKLSAGDPIDT